MRSYKNNLSLKELPSIRQLRAFAVLYETCNVSAAADVLSLTQPALTVLLRELEEKLGVRLFERGPRGLQRTEAALEAMAHVKRVLGDLNDMRTSLTSIASGSQGLLRIAATSTVAQSLMPRLIQRFRQTHPQVRIGLEDCSPSEFTELIATERVHFGIGTLETSVAGLTEKIFQKDWLHAVGHPDFLSQGTEAITWKQLASHPIIAVKPGYGIRRSIDHAVATANVRLELVHEVSLMSTALAMAGQKLGVAIAPGSLVSHAFLGKLVSRRLVRPLVPRHLAVVHRSDRALSPTAMAFMRNGLRAAA